MPTTEQASADQIDELIALESLLFAEDAAQHDTFVDTTWPVREGHQDFEQLLADPACVVLVDRDHRQLIGFLAGYWTPSSSTRLPVRYAVLRSLFVRVEHRRSGSGSRMTEQFIRWAKANDCVEAHVDSYIANDTAQHFYERHGFFGRSLSRSRTL